MESLFNLHTHCHYCDGADEPEAYVKAALEAGFHTLGFSSHAPVPFKNNFAIQDRDSLQAYAYEIRELKEKYRDRINIFLGLELDYISGISGDFEKYRQELSLDYTIGSVHLVRNHQHHDLWFIDGPKVESFDNGLHEIFGGDIRKAVTAYYAQVNEMLIREKPDIVGHFDKVKMHNRNRYFREDERWYRSLVNETLEVIRQTGVIVEVNTRGIYKQRSQDLYPGRWILEEMLKMRIPVTLSADAHHPSEIDGYYPETMAILRELGFGELMYLSPQGWSGRVIL
ncbi:MAG: histidinol-phosphatase [Bacteroidales bacterium]